MAVALRQICFQTFQLQGIRSVSASSNAKKNGGDPVTKLFLDKLAEFKKTKVNTSGRGLIQAVYPIATDVN